MVSGLQERNYLRIDGFYTPVSNLRYLPRIESIFHVFPIKNGCSSSQLC